MKNTTILILCLCANLFCQAQETINCLIKTSLGDIEVELFAKKAPVTVQNFVQYVEQNAYDNSSFFRVCTKENEADRIIKIEVIQGGDISKEKEMPPIALESTKTTGILHKNGVISMARSEPDSATSSFFICINDQPELDFGGKRNPDGQGFAAFGKVTKGMDVVKAIQKQTEHDQFLLKPVPIENIDLIGSH